MTTVDKVKKTCKEKGVSISKLEKALGFANGYIGQLKKGTLPNDRLVAIARYLKIPDEYLIGTEEEKFFSDELSKEICEKIVSAFNRNPEIAESFLIPSDVKKSIWDGTYRFSNITFYQFHELVGDICPKKQKAPSLSDEAMKVARDYSDLDHYGKQAVRDLIGTEKTRCEDDRRFLNDTQLPPEPLFVNLYSEPSAAGIAVPTMGKDYVPYELKPGDPKGAAYAVRVQGDSMEPAFHDGDIAFVNHDALSNGDVGIFCVDGGTVIKQYYHDPLGMTYLFSLNRSRADADVLINPTSNQTVVCQGRVITSKRYPLPTGI